MMNNKRGATELSMNTIIMAIIAIIVLLLIVTFFTGGLSTVFGKIRDVFKGGTAGYDVDLAKAQCQSYCERAKLLSNDQWETSTYCSQGFELDSNKDGSIESGEEDIKCKDSKLLGSNGCSPVSC
ncbi:MAG: hypothetical protein AABX49_00455 [Nanoarchaeota archaeon]